MEQKPEQVIKQEAEEATDQDRIKSRKVLKILKEQGCRYKFYSWEAAENYVYITYLTNFRQVFSSPAERKRVRVFRHLAKMLRTRNPHQIKSHHQKMMLRHGSVEAVIDFLKGKILKEVEGNLELAHAIEKINAQAQIFFLRELCGVTRPAVEPRQIPSTQLKLEEGQSREPSESGSLPVPKDMIKVEDQYVETQRPCCLKEEQVGIKMLMRGE